MQVKLVKKAEAVLTAQSYEKQSLVEGVRLVERKRFTGDDGAFGEVVRLEKGLLTQPEELKGFEVKQINHSLCVAGTLKAWHIHSNQDEVWFVHPRGALIAGLLDGREGSKTKGLTNRFCLGRGKAHLLYIPRGVAHGLSNPFSKGATMTYLVNNHFDGSDEKRLPFDFGVEKGFWQIKKG
ncbi:dTDP-4-dehydrorhamnose 3,5-epimerase family protein [Patescibacteria group bacterium]|nr:dTDP-4-dehydrorhamnose 3,5-epimerase family protein [Patescibacteria group bacterium]